MMERERFKATKRHTLEDRKMVRGLKNNEEGLPDVLRAVFLAMTEDGAELSPLRKGEPEPARKLKTTIKDLQQKDPMLFRQFQREVMKQYHYYKIIHHRNRKSFGQNSESANAQSERQSLVDTLKNAMSVIQNKTQFTSVILDQDNENPKKRARLRSPQSPMNSDKSKVASPTMIFDTLMAMKEENKEYNIIIVSYILILLDLRIQSRFLGLALQLAKTYIHFKGF